MTTILRRFIMFVCLVGLALPSTANAVSLRDPYDYCYKFGDYYDSDGQGYHVIECYYISGSSGGIDRFYIKHGTPFLIYQI